MIIWLMKKILFFFVKEIRYLGKFRNANLPRTNVDTCLEHPSGLIFMASKVKGFLSVFYLDENDKLVFLKDISYLNSPCEKTPYLNKLIKKVKDNKPYERIFTLKYNKFKDTLMLIGRFEDGSHGITFLKCRSSVLKIGDDKQPLLFCFNKIWDIISQEKLTDKDLIVYSHTFKIDLKDKLKDSGVKCCLKNKTNVLILYKDYLKNFHVVNLDLHSGILTRVTSIHARFTKSLTLNFVRRKSNICLNDNENGLLFNYNIPTHRLSVKNIDVSLRKEGKMFSLPLNHQQILYIPNDYIYNGELQTFIYDSKTKEFTLGRLLNSRKLSTTIHRVTNVIKKDDNDILLIVSTQSSKKEKDLHYLLYENSGNE